MNECKELPSPQNLHQRRQKDIDLLKMQLEGSGRQVVLDRLVRPVSFSIAPTSQFISECKPKKFKLRKFNASKQKNKASFLSIALSFTRSLLLDIPLLTSFSVLLGMCCIETIFHDYQLPLLRAAARASDDEQLRKEFTYYERECTSHDLSSKTGAELLLSNTTTPKEAVDIVMTHGSSIIPSLLKPETVKELRKFVDDRNNNLSKAEKIPVSQGKHRVSFGIEATEDPIIATALNEIANHFILEGLLQGLVGIDPALTEITAITARYGAKNQGWHPDVKPDGNALKFARTYSHSYSVFIPLQDTPAKMGATTICPGTHYCANWEVEDMCVENGFQLSEAYPEKVWRAGDGAILNQQMWHRGAKHSLKGGLDRIAFIVSFIGRPDETRQLSRGTYFHMKWLMWGHTFRDLHDAYRSMAKPFSIMRALSIWKPRNRNFGYDLVTATVMRIANMQQGGSPDDLPGFIENVIEKIFHLPRSLQGILEYSDHAWEIYLETTIEKIIKFLVWVNVAFISIYLFLICIASVVRRSFRPLKKASYRMLFTHGIPTLLAWQVLENIRTSDWGRGVITGRIMRPPFPDHLQNIKDADVSIGPTTMPTRDDILVGSRFDAVYLGAYDRWLDYHPGNKEFDEEMLRCRNMPYVLDTQLTEHLLATRGGRLLEQDWTTGDWRIMTPLESYRYVYTSLQKTQNVVMNQIAKSLAILLAYNRFDVAQSHMSQAMRKRLNDLKNQIIPFKSASSMKGSVLTNTPTQVRLGIKYILPEIPNLNAKSPYQAKLFPNSQRWIAPPAEDHSFQVGDNVYINYNDGGIWFRGRIKKIRTSGSLDIHYYDDDKQTKVPRRLAVEEVPLEENMKVLLKQEDTDGIEGTIKRVRPDGGIDMIFDSGETQRDINPNEYERIHH